VDHAPLPEGVVVVEEQDPAAPYAQRIMTGEHVFLADEPIGIGRDTGPTPYDLLLASLGACTSMTLRMYAARKHLPLEHVRVTLRHERTHAEDCKGADGAPHTIDAVDRQIELGGDLTNEQQAALARIADRCPIHRTLVGDVRVATTLVVGREGAHESVS
jgi:uncharacterized OsmC-like protein